MKIPPDHFKYEQSGCAKINEKLPEILSRMSDIIRLLYFAVYSKGPN